MLNYTRGGAVPAFPEPKHEPKGPLRKVDSLNEYKGQRASAAQHYSPIARPSAGGIQRVSLSAMAGNKNRRGHDSPRDAPPPPEAMGITGLNKLLRPLSRDVDARDYAQLAAGVDGSAWLHRAYWGAVAEDVDEPAELEARVCAYFEKYAAVLATELDVAVTVVFDGAPPAQKRAKTLKGTAGPPRPSPQSFVAAVRNTLAPLRNCATLVAPAEADAQLAFLARRGDVDVVLTDERTSSPLGAPRALGAVDGDGESGRTLRGDEFALADLGADAAGHPARFCDWSEDAFLSFCVACGCDYCPQVRGVGPVRARELVESQRDPERVAAALAELPNAPPDYAATFRRAFALFRHQRVVDPSTGDEAHLRPIAGLDRSLLGLPPFDGDGRDDFRRRGRGGGLDSELEEDDDEDYADFIPAKPVDKTKKRGSIVSEKVEVADDWKPPVYDKPDADTKFVTDILPKLFFLSGLTRKELGVLLALLYDAPRAATVKARDAVTCFGLDRKTFKSILQDTATKQRLLYADFLAQVPLFKGFSQDKLNSLCDALQAKDFEQGDVIIKEGDHGHDFYIIETGTAECTQSISGAEVSVCPTLGSGAFFGELALLKDAPRAATVTASSKLSTVRIDRATFKRMIGDISAVKKDYAKVK
ncbi:cAMP-dependent protein kinase regulator [Aureococcus anophagefferens]|nr:cAMP-dependent protein kinase regulator [Aureococcus anophagefferens]